MSMSDELATKAMMIERILCGVNITDAIALVERIKFKMLYDFEVETTRGLK